MKQCLLAAVGLFAGMCVFVMLLASAGTIIRETPQETVLSVSAPEMPSQGLTEMISFPYDIPDTTLRIRSHALYEGDMLETDSDTHVVDASALEVENYGDREVVVAYILLQVGGEEYHFLGANLPAHSTILLVELDGRPYVADNCSGCTGWVRYGEDEQLLGSALSVTEVDMGTIRVENISDQCLEDILLYHKNYLQESELYLGGVTYQTYIGTLQPGESIEVSPFRYASGYSKIIKAVPH